MHFQLPQNLLEQVVDYDPVLKPIYKAKKAAVNGKNTQSGPRMSLGVPDNLFPVEFASHSQQADWAKQLNGKPDKERVLAVGDYPHGKGLLIHTDSTWVALWFFYDIAREAHPDTIGKHDYLYGCSIAYRDTATSLAKKRNVCLGWDYTKSPGETRAFTLQESGTTEQVKYGRTSMIKHTLLVTQDDVRKGNDRIPYENNFKSYRETTRRKFTAHKQWSEDFGKTIKRWSDESSLFSRLYENNDIRKCVFSDARVAKFDYTKSFKEMILDSLLRHNQEPMAFSEMLKKPFFDKEINNTIAEMIEVYNDPCNNKKSAVKRPLQILDRKLESLDRFLTIYPDAAIDYCQQVYAFAGNLGSYHYYYANDAKEWFRENVPVASFVQILKKKAESATKSDWNHHITGMKVADMQDLSDVFNMIRTIADSQHKTLGDKFKKVQISRPNRWRLSELHDHLSAECFKIQTPNEKLRQDLFPEPVKVQLAENKWTFFQPFDIHQLAQWGNAVRNCVGSASSYREGIKKRTHFIVLAMLDGKPRFTIQLKLRNGILNVEQIADIGNRNLADNERSSYEMAFSEAISMRSSQLTPATNEPQQNENVLC